MAAQFKQGLKDKNKDKRQRRGVFGLLFVPA